MATSCTFTAMALPADGHVHSEWSWDTGDPRSAAAGTMERTCARAMRIGLPALASTEHFDPRGWSVDAQDLSAQLRPLVASDGVLLPPPLNLDGYYDSVERCRQQFPELRILTGVEFGQPRPRGGLLDPLTPETRPSQTAPALRRLPGPCEVTARSAKRRRGGRTASRCWTWRPRLIWQPSEGN
jgi:histidinol-phosphatase (PHP family)